MTDTIFPTTPIGAQLDATPKAERLRRRIEGNIQAQIVDAARERVPNVEAPANLPRTGARLLLKNARRKLASSNRFLNRATRRSLAKEVRLS